MRFKPVILAIVIAGMPISAQPASSDFFETKIRPVLATSCYSCHSSKLKAPMGGLVLDTKAGLFRGGGSGPSVVAGKPDASILLRAMRYTDALKMPPTGKLPDATVKDFEAWIAAGAPDPRVDTPVISGPAPGGPRTIDYAQGRKWWAFQPAKELKSPAVIDKRWPRTKLDGFVLSKLEANKIKPSPEADPRTLIQRIYLDLVGYKPSYQEIESYVANKSPKRYEQLVESLLASPQYGERWARYWLDVSRYAEDGLAGGQYLYAWRYRDWVIDAFNKDIPYNRFLQLQLAADQTPDATRSDLAALGYIGLGPTEHKEFKLSKDVIEGLMLDEWDERLDAVTRGTLGLSVSCARCHDHKFDPISIKDYYGLAGVFASTQSTIRPLSALDPETEKRFIWARQRYSDLSGAITNLSENKDIDQKTATEKIRLSREEQAQLKPELEALRDKYPELAPLITRVITPRMPGAPPPGGRRDFNQEGADAPFVNAVYDAGLWLDGSHPDYTLTDVRPGQPRDLPVYFRGTGGTGSEVVQRRFLTVLSTKPDPKFGKGSGRLDLAQSITSDAAPLTARVMVNRVWGAHFGSYLVNTPSDFGDRGDRPTNPELLDDLAARFIANNWSLKWLHREIVLSAAYRQSSRPRPEAMKKDESNKLIWRMNPRRLDIEAYRDTLLRAAGELDLKMGGPSVDLDASGNNRRTIYSRISRSRLNDLLRMYDFPSPMQHSPARVDTVTPMQQLFAMNSPFMERLATSLAASVEQETGSAKIRSLFRKVLSRDPTPSEIDASLTYIEKAPVTRLTQSLLAANEEIFWP